MRLGIEVRLKQNSNLISASLTFPITYFHSPQELKMLILFFVATQMPPKFS